MPIKWDAQADAKLLSAIIQVYDVKVNGTKLSEVAAIMGPDCTAKALKHRLGKIRALANTDATDAKVADVDEKLKKAPKATKPAGNVTKPGKGKKPTAACTPSPDGDHENYPSPPDISRPKRANSKRNYAELNRGNDTDADAEGEEDDGLDKRVKIEVGEDIGEGLRQTPDHDSEADEQAGIFS